MTNLTICLGSSSAASTEAQKLLYVELNADNMAVGEEVILNQNISVPNEEAVNAGRSTHALS